MLVVMQHGATPEQVRRVVLTIEELGYQARPMPGAQRTAVGLVGNDGRVDSSRLAALPGVKEIIHVTSPTSRCHASGSRKPRGFASRAAWWSVGTRW